MSENRRFSRVPFLLKGSLTVGTEVIPVQILDVSLKGALVELIGNLGTGQESNGWLEMPLEGQELVIRMEVSIAHSTGDRMGLRCTTIDLDSMTHLRRLMELNLGDPHLVERELNTLGES